MHHPGARPHPEVSTRNIVLTILLNLVITGAQVAGGLISGSLSLLSDALHNFSDGMALLTSYVAVRIGRKEKTAHKTYGYRRVEILAALLNAGVLIVVSFFLFKESIGRLITPAPISTGIMMSVAALGLLANMAGVLLLRRDAASSLNIRSAYLHLTADALTSVAVILAALLIRWFGFLWVDSLFTIFIGLYVLFGGYSVLREAVDILMQSAPRHMDIDGIRKRVEGLGEVESFHHIHVWRMTESESFLEGHVDLKEDYRLSRCGEIVGRIESILQREYGITHLTLQCEYPRCKDASTMCSES